MTNGQSVPLMFGIALAICSPRSPARRFAYGSRKSASGRSVSRARYVASQRAVSLMLRMSGSDTDASMRRDHRDSQHDHRGDDDCEDQDEAFAPDAEPVLAERRGVHIEAVGRDLADDAVIDQAQEPAVLDRAQGSERLRRFCSHRIRSEKALDDSTLGKQSS